jgi:hypothetical protein
MSPLYICGLNTIDMQTILQKFLKSNIVVVQLLAVLGLIGTYFATAQWGNPDIPRYIGIVSSVITILLVQYHTSKPIIVTRFSVSTDEIYPWKSWVLNSNGMVQLINCLYALIATIEIISDTSLFGIHPSIYNAIVLSLTLILRTFFMNQPSSELQ